MRLPQFEVEPKHANDTCQCFYRDPMTFEHSRPEFRYMGHVFAHVWHVRLTFLPRISLHVVGWLPGWVSQVAMHCMCSVLA